MLVHSLRLYSLSVRRHCRKRLRQPAVTLHLQSQSGKRGMLGGASLPFSLFMGRWWVDLPSENSLTLIPRALNPLNCED